MITGYPSSGKTTVAVKIKQLLEEKISDSKIPNLKVELINDESLNLAKETYREARTEKATRGAQMSAVKKLLNRDTIVILDNLTYIKGFRYQLFCEARAVTTNSCVLHVGAPVEKCKTWNQERKSKYGPDSAWKDDLFDALVFRYEEPNGMSRWDSPLFFIASHELPFNDETKSIEVKDQENEELLHIDSIWNTLVLRRPKPPNQATLLKAATPTNYLFELDRITQEIVSSIFELQKLNQGGSVKIKDYPVNVQLPYKHMTIAQLQHIRRSYLALNKMKNVETGRIPVMFIEYLNKYFDRDD